MPRSYESVTDTYHERWQQRSPPAGPSRGVCWRPQRRPFSQLPLLALRAAALKALLVAEGTFSSKALGDGNVPWRSSQLCLSERLLGEGFEGFLSLPEARCRFVFTASFVWLAGFFFFLIPFPYYFAFINA